MRPIKRYTTISDVLSGGPALIQGLPLDATVDVQVHQWGRMRDGMFVSIEPIEVSQDCSKFITALQLSYAHLDEGVSIDLASFKLLHPKLWSEFIEHVETLAVLQAKQLNPTDWEYLEDYE